MGGAPLPVAAAGAPGATAKVQGVGEFASCSACLTRTTRVPIHRSTLMEVLD